MTLLPHSEEAEKGVLSSMLVDPAHAIPIAAQQASILHFHIPAHGVIFNLLTLMWGDSKPIDLVTVTQELRECGLLASVGGASYVTDLQTFVPSSANIQYYLDMLKDKFILRELFRASTDIANECYRQQDDVPALLASAQDQLFRISTPEQETDPKFSELLSQAMSNIENAADGKAEYLGTGLVDLDKKTGGFRPSQLIVVTGKTGEGKTALGLNIVQHMAEKGVPCGIISLEMSGEDLAERLLASSARTSLHNASMGKSNPAEINKIMLAAGRIGHLPIFIKEDSDIDLGMIRGMARQLVMQHKIQFLLVDYVQLISASSKENRARELAITSQGLKQCAKELGITVMALSQVNDDGNIFDSRAIGFDADKIIKISHAEGGDSWLTVAKNRKGPTGLVKVVFIRDFAKFESAAR